LKHVEPSINFGIINSITSLHLVGYSSASGLYTYINIYTYINQRLKIQFGTPDDERYAARNMLSLQ